MLRRVNKEDFRYSLLLATFFHMVLFLALFLSLRHSTKRLFLAPPLQVIHATAIQSESFSQKIASSEPEKLKPAPNLAKPITKPVLLEKSPVILPIKQKKPAKIVHDKTIPLKTTVKEPSLIKKTIITKSKTSKPLAKTPKKLKITQLKSSKKSLKLVEKNVQQLLEQEMKTLTQQQINALRNVATTDKYRHLILQSIAHQWIIPPEMNKHLETRLAVHLAPGGMVLEVVIVKSSGNSVLDRSAQTAVYKASPLPVPKNSSLFNNFRQINLTVRPEGVMTQ